MRASYQQRFGILQGNGCIKDLRFPHYLREVVVMDVMRARGQPRNSLRVRSAGSSIIPVLVINLPTPSIGLAFRQIILTLPVAMPNNVGVPLEPRVLGMDVALAAAQLRYVPLLLILFGDVHDETLRKLGRLALDREGKMRDSLTSLRC